MTPMHALTLAPFKKGSSMNRPKNRLAAKFLAAVCLAAPLALLPAQAAQAQSVSRPANDILLSIGRGQLVTVGGTMADVFVANEQVADVQVKSGRQLYVFGKAGGETTVYANNAAGDVIWSANVRVGSNLDNVDQMLRLAMPDAKIAVSTMGTSTFLLTGTVAAPEDAAEAQRLVEAFVGKEANVISRLKMATPLQVNLQVRFAEVSRSLVRQIGTNMSTMDQTGGFKFGVATGRSPQASFSNRPEAPLGVGFNSVSGYGIDPVTGNLAVLAGTAIPRLNQETSTIAGVGKLFGLDILGALDLGESLGLVTSLANPNLTALSGETADFLAGGEFPIPMSQGLGATSIDYKKFGVSLSYTPTVLANGRISMRVRPEVSELSSQGAIAFNGFQVPALTVRRAETTIELGSGQSFMIAGLMSNSSQNTLKKMPGVGDIPILGSLFRSTNFQRGETELVIVVTPYLVNPVDANDIKLPTDGYQNANTLQQLLGHLEHDGKSGADRPKPSAAPAAISGPKVGELDAPAAPAASAKADKKAKNKSRTADASKGAAPGFSLN